MLRSYMTYLGVPALALAALLLGAGPGSAQVYFSIGPGGVYAGYGRAYYPGWASPYYYPSYSAGYSGSYSSYYPTYAWPSYYSLYAPNAAQFYRPPDYVSHGSLALVPSTPTIGYVTVPETTTTYTAARPALLAPEARGDRALMDVHVPGNAEVWIEDVKMTQSGTNRGFESPPLTPGRAYTYRIRARWSGDNGPVEQTKEVPVRAGEQVQVDFARP